MGLASICVPNWTNAVQFPLTPFIVHYAACGSLNSGPARVLRLPCRCCQSLGCRSWSADPRTVAVLETRAAPTVPRSSRLGRFARSEARSGREVGENSRASNWPRWSSTCRCWCCCANGCDQLCLPVLNAFRFALIAVLSLASHSASHRSCSLFQTR
jgi:hypothetical protein